MAKATVDVLVDDLDGSEGVETVRIGWNGDWRELDLSKKNLAALSKAFDRYWNVSRPVSADGRSGRRRPPQDDVVGALSQGEARSEGDSGLGVGQRDRGTGAGRIPGDVERRYNEANGVVAAARRCRAALTRAGSRSKLRRPLCGVGCCLARG